MITGTLRKQDWHVVPDMWTVPSRHLPASLSGDRPSLVVPGEVDTVSVEGLHDTLPLAGEWADDAGHRWKRYEMPMPRGNEQLGPQSELLRLALHFPSGDAELVEVTLRDGTPRPGQDDRELGEPGTAVSAENPWEVAGERAMRMIAEHVDWTKRLVDQPSSTNGQLGTDGGWDRRAAGLVAPSVERALEEWKQNRQNEPRLALIVEIARKHETLITSICRQPRRVLARSRQVVGLGRIQEIDAGCLRWLARQPGTSVAERAGVRQRVMGVVRHESADTPENRVVKDFLKRAIAACGRYQREYRDFPEHHRVKLVARFRHVLLDHLLNSPISSVRPLVGLAQPNYVLQQDSRYRILWREYVKLVREQTAEDDLWRWQHRVWSEVCFVAAQAILAAWSQACSARQSEFWLHQEQVAGRYISPWTMPGRWPLHISDGMVDLIDGRMLGMGSRGAYPAPDSVSWLSPLAPDFVLIRWKTFDEPFAVAPVWTMFDFDVDHDRLKMRTTAISEHMAEFKKAARIRGLLLQPWRSRQTTHSDFAESEEHCLGVRLRLPLQTAVEDLELLMLEALE